MESSVKPIDEEIPTICQFDMEKKEELLISEPDSDDEIQMWVEKPVVIDLTCSYDESTLDCSHAKVVEMESNLNDPKVIEIHIDNDVGSCPSQDPANSSTGGTSGTVLQDFINVVCPSSRALRVRTVESLNQALLMPHAAPLCSTGTSPVNSATSSENVLPNHHAVYTNHLVTAPGGTTTSQSEPKDETRHATKKRSMSISSERIDDENHSKKIKLKSCDRFYDATALRGNSKKKDDDRQTSATSINTKSDLFNSERNQQSAPSRRRRRRSRFSTYENSSPSRNHSSLVHSVKTSSTSTHQQATEKYAKTCEEDSHSGQKSSSAKTYAWRYEDSNAANQKNKHSLSSENQRSSRLSVGDNFSSRRSRFRSRSPIHQRDIVENGKTSKGYRPRYSSADKRSNSQPVWDPSASYTNNNNATRMNKYTDGASEIQRSPRTRDDIHWESISLTKDRCRPLTSTLKGFNFLNNVYGTYGIKMNLTWSQNITLHIRGTKLQRTRFKGDLAMFIDSEVVNNGIESPASASNGSDLQSQAFNRFDPNLPRSKDRLIKKIEDNLDLLHTYLGNVEVLFADITTENKQSKISMKQANRSRKDLNIILMGQAGLRDGPKHLAEIKRLMKTLKNINGDVINKTFIATITPHFNYIFSSYQHDDYPALIAEYKKSLKTNRSTNDSTEASNKSDGPAQVPANMPIESAHQRITSDSTEVSNSCDGAAQFPAKMLMKSAHQTVTSDSTEASNSSDGPAQVPANMPIESAHQRITSDSTEASNSCDGPAQFPAKMLMKNALQTVTSYSSEASNNSDGPVQVPADMPIKGVNQTVTSDSAEASNHCDGPAQFPAKMLMKNALQTVTSYSSEASNNSDGPVQVPADMPIKGAHQTVTNDSTEASNTCDGPAQVPANMSIKGAHQTDTSDMTEASNNSDGPAQVPANMPIEGAHETVTSDSTEASTNISGPEQVPANMSIEGAQRTTTSCAIDSSIQPSIEGAQQVVAGN